jgi:transcriptional regulator with XRE-family HTH domain
MNSENQPFGVLLKSAIRKRGISTSEFSRRLETSTAYLQNIESGRRSAGPEIMSQILKELDLTESERLVFLNTAAAQSGAVKAGIELGSWKAAGLLWQMFGGPALKDMGLDPNSPNRQFRWQPVVHEKWFVRCQFRFPGEVVFLGIDKKQTRLEAAYKPFDLRPSTTLPKLATHWWKLGFKLGPMNSDGTSVFSVTAAQKVPLHSETTTKA